MSNRVFDLSFRVCKEVWPPEAEPRLSPMRSPAYLASIADSGFCADAQKGSRFVREPDNQPVSTH